MKSVAAEDLLHYSFIENLKYSPDGKNLAYQRAFAEEDGNGYHRDVWVIENGKPRQLTSGRSAEILCWKDSETLYLKRETEKKKKGYTELFTMSLHGGEAMPAAQLPVMIGTLAETDDGTLFALAATDSAFPDFHAVSAEKQEEYLKEKENNSGFEVLDEIPFWMNGLNYVSGKRTSVFRIDPETWTVEKLTEPLFDASELMVHGSDVYYCGTVRGEKKGYFNQVYVYHNDTGETETVYGKNDLTIHALFWMKGLYAQATDHKEYGTNETAWIVRLEKDHAEKILKPEVSLHCSVGADTMLKGGKSGAARSSEWVTVTTEKDRTPLYVFRGDKTMERIDPGDLSISFLDASEEETAVCAEDSSHLAEIYILGKDGIFRRVTSHNENSLKDRYVAEPGEIEYESHGEKLKGWVLLPKDYDPSRSWPAVLEIHGGPRTVYGTRFHHEMQMLAGMGFFVFFTNIHGSDGSGDAFADIRGRYGEIDYENLMDFTDAVLKAWPAIDQKKVCVTGGSYGGFMTNWIIGHTHRFCCAVSQRSISNWISKSFMSDIGFYFGPDQAGSEDPFDFKALWDHSPLKYAKGADTPTLFIHSDEDRRCPLPEGMQMMTALALQGVETRMVVFHGETHELSRSGRPKNRMQRLHAMSDWFVSHTK